MFHSNYLSYYFARVHVAVKFHKHTVWIALGVTQLPQHLNEAHEGKFVEVIRVWFCSYRVFVSKHRDLILSPSWRKCVLDEESIRQEFFGWKINCRVIMLDLSWDIAACAKWRVWRLQVSRCRNQTSCIFQGISAKCLKQQFLKRAYELQKLSTRIRSRTHHCLSVYSIAHQCPLNQLDRRRSTPVLVKFNFAQTLSATSGSITRSQKQAVKSTHRARSGLKARSQTTSSILWFARSSFICWYEFLLFVVNHSLDLTMLCAVTLAVDIYKFCRLFTRWWATENTKNIKCGATRCLRDDGHSFNFFPIKALPHSCSSIFCDPQIKCLVIEPVSSTQALEQ
jgi:hypothetical protein